MSGNFCKRKSASFPGADIAKKGNTPFLMTVYFLCAFLRRDGIQRNTALCNQNDY